MSSLDKLRSRFGQGMIALIWANVVLIAVAAFSIAHVSAIVATGSALISEQSNSAALETDQASAAVLDVVKHVKRATDQLNQRIDRFVGEVAA
jgi:hypothetical protein